MISALVAACVLAGAGQADATPKPPPAAAPTIQQRYDAAVDRMVQGDLEHAAAELDALAADPQAGDLAAPARELASVARRMAARAHPTLQLQQLGEPKPDRSGRAELVFYDTLFGIWAGVATGVASDASDAKIYIALMIAGGGLGLGTSLAATREGRISTGRAVGINSLATWGSFNGAMIAGISDMSARGGVGFTLGAGLLGLAGGVVATHYLEPSAGDVAIVNSGGFWGAAAGLLGALGVVPESSQTSKVMLSTVLVCSDLGLAGLIGLTPRVEISRGHSLMIDVGGAMGLLLGLSVPFFADAKTTRPYGFAGLAGMGAGLGAAAWLTRGWEADSAASDASAAPSPAGQSPAPPAGAEGRGSLPVVMIFPGGGYGAGIAGQF